MKWSDDHSLILHALKISNFTIYFIPQRDMKLISSNPYLLDIMAFGNRIISHSSDWYKSDLSGEIDLLKF